MTITQKLARFAVEKSFRDIPPSVIHDTKIVVLDAIGCALGGYGMKNYSKIIVDIARGLGGPRESSILGDWSMVSCVSATYANAKLGIFTPTEAAVIASVYAIIVELFIYRFLKITKLVNIFIDSGVTTGTLLIIVAGASTFGEFITMKQVPVKNHRIPYTGCFFSYTNFAYNCRHSVDSGSLHRHNLGSTYFYSNYGTSVREVQH